jgi:CRP-like cAMP-binding protein
MLDAVRRSAQQAAEEARARHYALGPVLVALRLYTDAGLEPEAQQLAARCAAGFGLGDQAGKGLVALARKAKHLHFAAGEILVRAGERAENCFVVFDGQVALDFVTTGRVSLLAAGDSFGETELVRGSPRQATAVAGEGGASVLRLDAAVITSVQQNHRGVKTLLNALYRERVLAGLGCNEGWLGGLQGEQRRSLLARFEERRYRDADRIVTAGERSEGFFVLIGGEASVRRDGEELVRLVPGAFFGEISVLEGVPATADVVAVGGVETLCLRPNAFHAVMSVHPDQLDEIAGVARARRGFTPPPLLRARAFRGAADNFVLETLD